MPLEPGTELGLYRVTGPLGAAGSGVARCYDPSPDGRSFAMVAEPREGDREIHIVLNFLSELEARAPRE